MAEPASDGDAPSPKPGHLVANEKAKLTAAWLNALGSGSIIIGVLAPIAAAIFGAPQTAAPGWAVLLAGLGFLILGLLAHAGGRAVLEGLRE